MKLALKIIFCVLGAILILLVGFIVYYYSATATATLDESKLIDLDCTVTYCYSDGEIITTESSGSSITSFEDIPAYTKNAFVAIEDKRFYSHNGVDYKGLLRATVNNIKSFSFKEGASTISQQLIKNTHLSSKKTLNRKFTEMHLAKQLESKFSKDEILEKYLNTIYFGDNCFGITSASKHYFNKTPNELSLAESATLAGLVKAPSYYSPNNNYEKCIDRRNLVLNNMLEQNYISNEEYETAKNADIVLENEQVSKEYSYLYLARKEFYVFLEKSPYNAKKYTVITNCDKEIQNSIKANIIPNASQTDASAVVIDSNFNTVAYYSTCGNIYRQLGSTIKPLLVYAPALENGIISPESPILDEKINFNGYSPSNFNDKYYGYVSAKESLAKSLNSCAVKIFNYTGIEKSLSYLKKTDIAVSETDNSLALALGSFTNGASLIEITNAYGIFNNKGNYSSASTINEIYDENGAILYKQNKTKVNIFTDETVSLTNDMLRYAVTDGTAKKLSFTNMNLYGKTGTVGNENGNTDAYAISFSKDYTIGIWFGNSDYSLMDNSITGGGLPANLSANIWQEIYDNKTEPDEIEASSYIVEKEIDKISLDDDHLLILADENAPKRYVETAKFNIKYIPNTISTRFSSPQIEKPILSVNNKQIYIRLCLTEYIDAKIYRKNKGRNILIWDSKNKSDKELFTDDTIIENQSYVYTVIPYCNINGKEFLGAPIELDKIKAPSVKNPKDDWWLIDD